MLSAGRRRPSLLTILFIITGVGWSAIQVVRVGLYLAHHEGASHPLMLVANAVLGMTFGLCIAAFFVSRATAHIVAAIDRSERRATDRIVAAIASSEADRDQIMARLHDRIESTAAESRTALDRSMNWVLRRITHE